MGEVIAGIVIFGLLGLGVYQRFKVISSRRYNWNRRNGPSPDLAAFSEAQTENPGKPPASP